MNSWVADWITHRGTKKGERKYLSCTLGYVEIVFQLNDLNNVIITEGPLEPVSSPECHQQNVWRKPDILHMTVMCA